MDYDTWLSTNPAYDDDVRNEKAFELWLDNQDNESLANYIKKDLVLFVSGECLDWDYPDKILERFIDVFYEDLFTYFLENEV